MPPCPAAGHGSIGAIPLQPGSIQRLTCSYVHINPVLPLDRTIPRRGSHKRNHGRSGVLHRHHHRGRITVTPGVISPDTIVPGANHTGVYADIERNTTGIIVLFYKDAVPVDLIDLWAGVGDVDGEIGFCIFFHCSRTLDGNPGRCYISEVGWELHRLDTELLGCPVLRRAA